jgi:hypothetical protein
MPMARPEPATTSFASRVAVASVHRSSSPMASAMPKRTPCPCSSAMRSRTAASPRATLRCSIRPTRSRRHCACSTRTRLASVIGVSGCCRIGLSDSSRSPTNRWPLNTVRPFSGKAGVTMAKSAASSASSASATGPMLPCGVESKVEQTLK